MPRAWRRPGCVRDVSNRTLYEFVCVCCLSKVGPSSGEPCPPFYRPRGEQGLQMRERGKYYEYRRSFEGFGSPFFLAPVVHNMADRVRSGMAVDLRRPCPGLICKWARPVPPPRAACRTGLSISDPVGSGWHSGCSFATVEDGSPSLEHSGCRMSVSGSSPGG